jgi:hypothetical protein
MGNIAWPFQEPPELVRMIIPAPHMEGP